MRSGRACCVVAVVLLACTPRTRGSAMVLDPGTDAGGSVGGRGQGVSLAGLGCPEREVLEATPMGLRAGGHGFAAGSRLAIATRGGTALVDARTGAQSSFLAEVGALGWLDQRTLLARVWRAAPEGVSVPRFEQGGTPGGEVLPRETLVSLDVLDGSVKPLVTVPFASAIEYLAGARGILVVHGSDEFTVASTAGRRLWGIPALADAEAPLTDERSFLGAMKLNFVIDPARPRVAVVGKLASEVRAVDSGEVLGVHPKLRILGFSSSPSGFWAQGGDVRWIPDAASAEGIRLDLEFTAVGAAQHGNYVVFFGGERAELWSIEPAQRLRAWSRPGVSFSRGAWLENGCRVLLGADEGSWLYDPRSGRLVQDLPAAALASGASFQGFLGGGELAVFDGSWLTLWSPRAPGLARRRSLAELVVGSASGELYADTAGDGLLWFAADGSGTAIWQLDASLAAPRRLGSLAWSGPGRNMRASASTFLVAGPTELRVWTREGLRPRAHVRFSDPRLAAVTLGPRSGDIYVHRAGSSALEQLGPGGGARRRLRLPASAGGCVEELEMSADEQWLAAIDCSGEVLVWQTPQADPQRLSLPPRRRFRPSHPFHAGSQLRWSPDEARLLVVDEGRDPAVIDMRRREQSTLLRDPRRPEALPASGLAHAAFAPDGAHVLVQRGDGVFELWDGAGAVPLAHLALFADGSWVVWRRDGRYQLSEPPGAAAASFAAAAGVQDRSLAATLFAAPGSVRPEPR